MKLFSVYAIPKIFVCPQTDETKQQIVKQIKSEQQQYRHCMTQQAYWSGAIWIIKLCVNTELMTCNHFSDQKVSCKKVVSQRS